MKKSRIIAVLSAAACVMSCTSCSGNPFKAKEKVTLTIWNMEDNTFLQKMGDEFSEKYKNDAEIKIVIEDKPENSMSEYIAANPDSTADIFYFADDQFDQFYNNKYLLPAINKSKISEDNGGIQNNVISCIYKGGEIYAYPLTAGNGYFLYYNAEYFSDKDVEKLDTILDIAAKNNKSFAMDWSSGWYTYSFFGGAGLKAEASALGLYNFCNWNTTEEKYKGVDVAKAMIEIGKNKGFLNCVNDSFLTGAENGTVIACVSGQWDAENLKNLWGDNLRASKLPTYTINGNQVQMSGFIGYKYAGVYSGTKYPEWASKFAEYLSDYEHQVERFSVTGECPSNLKAMDSVEVQKSVAVVALAEQAPFSVQQRLTDAYWTPASTLGTILASGNPDNRDLQQLLDETVEQITVQ